MEADQAVKFIERMFSHAAHGPHGDPCDPAV